MSAYIVEQNTIAFIVQAAIGYGIIKRDESITTANMLWKENQNSIRYRYGNNTDGYDSIGRFRSVGHLGVFNLIEPSQVEYTCDNLDYQSCEHPEWRDSKAYSLLVKIRQTSRKLYEVAARNRIWGAPTPTKITRIKF